MIKPSRSALAVIAGALASILAPPAVILPSEWARKNIIVPDGPRAGEPWDPKLTPYAVEIVDSLAPETAINEVAVRKSSQVGLSTLGVAFIGHSIDCDPCRMMVVQSSIDALSEYNREKLTPILLKSPALKSKVYDQTSRSSTGSTSFSKRFPGGSVKLANANSAKDLSSSTIKKVHEDEVDRWPDDLDGQGDPSEMVEARMLAFRATGDWKRLTTSTPTLKGSSRIDKKFMAGDQRYWHIRCPHCHDEIPLFFGNNEKFGLKFERERPYHAHYVTQCCGSVVEHHQKIALVCEGRFIATAEGGYPSFHIDTLISPFVPWDVIAAKWWSVQGDEEALKGFFNLWLGLPFEIRGDAPDWQRLMERREDYPPRTIPIGGIVLTGMADVQASGIYAEIVAFGEGLRSWTVEREFLDGETTDANAGAFAKLAQLRDRRYVNAYGIEQGIDAFGVDSGYQSHVVYAFTRSRPDTFAFKGMSGWFAPPIGTPGQVDVDYKGRKIKRGALVWPVGTWGLKAQFYGNLRKEGRRAGAEDDPPGYCHFGGFCDEVYFRQLTSEYLKVETKNGVTRKVWHESGPNHFLDCRIGNMALAEHLGLSRMLPEAWARIAHERGAPDRPVDIFSPDLTAVAARPEFAQPAISEAPARDGDWLSGRGDGWI